MRSLPEIITQNATPPDWARERIASASGIGRYAWEPEHSVTRPSRLDTAKHARLIMDAEGTAVPYWTPETLAKAWVDAPHEPQSNAWAAYIDEIDYLAATWTGEYPVEVFNLDEPYNSANDMRIGWNHRGRLLIASSANLEWEDDHPLNEFPMGIGRWTHYRRNFWARALHDLYGHVWTDNPFGFVGEILAYRAESQQFPALAYPALFAEVLGQAAYHEVYGRFPDVQKCAVIEPRRILV